MITDALATFADDLALNTGAAGTYVIGDQYHLGADNALHDVSDLFFVAQIGTAATSGGAATLQIELVTASNAALTADVVVIATSGEIPVADLTAGKRILAASIPLGSNSGEYLGIRQVTGTAAFTGGELNAFVTKSVSNYRAFADGLN